MQILDKRKALAIAPLFRLAFRGFFLFGCLLAMIAVPLWILAIHGNFNDWQPVGGWLGWHQHEMIFAFAGAIIGGLILAMLARVSLGHTGHPLTLPKGFALAFIWLNLGAIARVFAVGFWYMPALTIAAGFWTLAFAQYVCCYGPMLCKARADGHPG